MGADTARAALWYVLLGEHELALNALVVRAEPGLGNVLSLRGPILEPLHGEPRYREILARLGLAPEGRLSGRSGAGPG